MNRTHFCFFLVWLALSTSLQGAREILLQLAPEDRAPVIAKITATEKVILDAAPAGQNAEGGWRKLALPTPFEGYVPVATLDKNLKIVEGTAAHYLPTTESAAITRVEADDRYEVVRVHQEWATVRFQKNITGYFIDDSTEEVAIDFKSLQAPLVPTEPASATSPTPRPQPVAIPAPRARINPDEPIGQLDPSALPEENVVWKPARGNGSQPLTPHSPLSTPHSQLSNPLKAPISPIIVSPEQTQAREADPDLGPAKTPRLLAGRLFREINASGPGYPIRLKSPEGRLIAYVDLSRIYISDLAPYIDQRVYIRGQIYPMPNNAAQLVILADSLRLAE